MKQVLLIDDEPLVLESIHTGVDWGTLGAEVCAQCTDPFEAIDYVKGNPVDVVVTDVFMPSMNGLVLCNQIQRICPRSRFIIVSSYADFSYAQKAMQFGCIGYCLKPIDYNELTGYLKKALGPGSAPDAPYYEFVEALYENNIEQIQWHLDQQGIREPFWTAASVGQDTIHDLAKGFCCSTGVSEYLYISNQPFRPGPELTENRRVRGIAYREEPITCTRLWDSLNQLIYSCYQFFFYPEQRIFQKPCVYLEGLLEEARLFPRQPVELERRLRGLRGRFSHIQQAAELYNLFYQEAGGEGTIYTYRQLAFVYRDYDAMVRGLLDLMQETSPEELVPGSGNKSFLSIIKYVHENYTRDISIQHLADQMYMNPCYISQLFKKETGETFVKYLTGLRMRRAEELLRTTDWSVKRISEECGFNDPFYFIKAFKKYAGQTPSAYRKSSLPCGR